MRKSVFGLAATLLLLLFAAIPVRGDGPPPPPPPPPGYTPRPTLAPPCAPSGAGCATATATLTPTATATPTATSVPLTLRVKLQHGAVNPRTTQRVSVSTLAGAAIRIVVRFPNGDSKKHSGISGMSGRMSWNYVQPGSRITHGSRTASVTVDISLGTDTKHSVKRYTVGFAALDVSVEPRKQKRGSVVSTWVHTSARTNVTVQMVFSAGSAVYLRGKTGSDGWTKLRFLVPAGASSGHVDARANAGGFRGETSWQVS